MIRTKGGEVWTVKQSSKTPWNGGENFAKAYDAFAPAKGILNVENGTFFTPSNLFVSVVGEGTLQVGSDGVVLARNVTLSNTVLLLGGKTSKESDLFPDLSISVIFI